MPTLDDVKAAAQLYAADHDAGDLRAILAPWMPPTAPRVSVGSVLPSHWPIVYRELIEAACFAELRRVAVTLRG